MNRGIQNVLLEEISSMPFARFGALAITNELERIALELADRLEEEGYVSCPVPAFRYYDYIEGRPLFSHKHAAVAAGLGHLGWGGFLVTPKFGGAVQLCSVLTSAKLIPDQILEKNLCDKCMECVKICPSGAISRTSTESFRINGQKYSHGRISKIRCMWACGGLQKKNTYSWSDVPRPPVKNEEDLALAHSEFMRGEIMRNEWQKHMAGQFRLIFCSKCYLTCHPEEKNQT
ncbi:MAG: epoxyqueuosine reductase [Elusimicrobia bacterium]|nr:MAG: epoxyqueuosine reductase [Elusimicrobiota bacterium]